MRVIREPAIASRGEWARALVALLLAAGLVVWVVAHTALSGRSSEAPAGPEGAPGYHRPQEQRVSNPRDAGATGPAALSLLSSLDALQARAERLDARRMLAMDAGVACRAACPLEPAHIVFKGDTVDCACRRVVLP